MKPILIIIILLARSLVLAEGEVEKRLDHKTTPIPLAREMEFLEKGVNASIAGEVLEDHPATIPTNELQEYPSVHALTSGEDKVSNSITKFLTGLILAIISGGVAGTLLRRYFEWRRNMEYRSLLLGLTTELVLAFNRCVTYYKQYKTREFSYSAIFNFSDSSTVSRLAAVTDDPNLVQIIIDLKSIYFQVNRHAEIASDFAAQGKRLEIQAAQILEVNDEDRKEKEKLLEKRKICMDSALQPQGTAVAFFVGEPPMHLQYEKARKGTEALITASYARSQKREKEAVRDLRAKFWKSEICFNAIQNLLGKLRPTLKEKAEWIQLRKEDIEGEEERLRAGDKSH